MTFPFTKQPDAMDCGPACLRMVSEHYGKRYTLDYPRMNCFIGRDGVSLLGISRAAKKIGFKTVGGRLTFDKLAEKAPLPCIVHWNQEYFVVVYKNPPFIFLDEATNSLDANNERVLWTTMGRALRYRHPLLFPQK